MWGHGGGRENGGLPFFPLFFFLIERPANCLFRKAPDPAAELAQVQGARAHPTAGGRHPYLPQAEELGRGQVPDHCAYYLLFIRLLESILLSW